MSTERGIILAISTQTGKISRTIRVAGVCCEADQLIGAPNGKIAYAASFTDKITPIDLVTGRALRPISVPRAPVEPSFVAVSHNGGTLLVVGSQNATKTVVTVVTGHRANRPISFKGKFAGGCVAVNADGTMGYFLRLIKGHFDLVPIDIATNSPLRAIKVSGEHYGTSTDQCLALAPNSRTAYAQIGPNVVPIDLVTGRALRPITIPDASTGFSQLGIDPDGTMAYVRGDGGVTPIDLAARKALPTIFFSGDLGGFSLSFSPNGKTALVGIGQLRTGKLLLIHAGTGKVYKSIHVTDGVPASIAVTP
jgi:DNA-binding beta-propeller fold protein YncE